MFKIDHKIYKDEKTGIERIEYFDEHWYKIDADNIYPSVTKVISDVISKGYGYDKWLKDVGNEATFITREAAESGSKIHDAIEQILKGETVKAVSDFYSFNKLEWKKLNHWLDWWNWLTVTHGAKAIAIETIVFCRDWKVAGTGDLVCMIDDELWLIDWKSGNSIYETGELQVAAYAEMWNRLNAEKIKNAALVHIGANIKGESKGTLNNTGIKVKEVDIEFLRKQFENTLSLFKWRFPNAKAPNLEYAIELKANAGVLIEAKS